MMIEEIDTDGSGTVDFDGMHLFDYDIPEIIHYLYILRLYLNYKLLRVYIITIHVDDVNGSLFL